MDYCVYVPELQFVPQNCIARQRNGYNANNSKAPPGPKTPCIQYQQSKSISNTFYVFVGLMKECGQLGIVLCVVYNYRIDICLNVNCLV